VEFTLSWLADQKSKSIIFSDFSQTFFQVLRHLILPSTVNFATFLCSCLSAAVAVTIVGDIPCSHLISGTHFPCLKLAAIFNFISKVWTNLDLLAFSFDFALRTEHTLGTESVAKTK
jgi:hypothetical protein